MSSIKSSLNQTYNNIEILIIDDCSQDNTERVIKKIRDRRIKYIKIKENKGACYARNIGIQMAKGEYIAFQDSDDIFHFDKLEKQFNNLKKMNSDMDFCKISVNINNYERYFIPMNKTDKLILNGSIYDELLSKGNFISTQSILIKKYIIKKYLFDTKFPRLQDYDLVLRIIPNIKVSYTNEALVDLYMQNDSITNCPKKLQKSINLLLKKNYNFTLNQKTLFLKYLKEVQDSLKEKNKLF